MLDEWNIQRDGIYCCFLTQIHSYIFIDCYNNVESMYKGRQNGMEKKYMWFNEWKNIAIGECEIIL